VINITPETLLSEMNVITLGPFGLTAIAGRIVDRILRVDIAARFTWRESMGGSTARKTQAYCKRNTRKSSARAFGFGW
jgi:hypothetical protein